MKKIETSILLNAPTKIVWSALTDFESYHFWNPYYPFINGKKNIGETLTVKTKPPKLMAMKFKAVIYGFTPSKLFSWKAKFFIKGLFDSHHELILIDNGNNTTTLQQVETFRGILVGFVGYILKKSEEGFGLMNLELKKICEEQIKYSSRLFTNWAGTFSFTAEYIFFPKDDTELRDIIKNARDFGKKLKIIGSAHSFSEILCSINPHTWIVKLNYFNHIDFDSFQLVDEINNVYSIKVGGGIILEDLAEKLSEKKMRLMNTGSITKQTISGAISTNTHGSGIKHGGFVSFAKSVSIINGNGEFIEDITETNNPDLFYSVLCGIGMIGIILEVELLIAKNEQSKVESQFINFNTLLDQKALNSLLFSNEIFEGFWYPYVNTFYACKKNPVNLPNSGRIEAWKLKAAYIYGNIVYMSRFALIKKIAIFNRWFIPFSFWIDNLLMPKLDFVRPKHEDSIENFEKDSWKELYDCEIFFNYSYTAEILTELQKLLEKASRKGDFYCEFPIHVRFLKGDSSFLSQAYSDFVEAEIFTSFCIPGTPDNDPRNSYTAIADKVKEILLRHGKEERYRFHLGKNLPPDFGYLDFLRNNPKLLKWLEVRERNDQNNLFVNNPWVTKVLNIPYEVLDVTPNNGLVNH